MSTNMNTSTSKLRKMKSNSSFANRSNGRCPLDRCYFLSSCIFGAEIAGAFAAGNKNSERAPFVVALFDSKDRTHRFFPLNLVYASSTTSRNVIPTLSALVASPRICSFR